MTTAFQVESSRQYSRFGKTSPGYNIPDSDSMKRADIFTPAYAHPMHQPQRMTSSSYQPRKLEIETREEEEKRVKREYVNKSFPERQFENKTTKSDETVRFQLPSTPHSK